MEQKELVSFQEVEEFGGNESIYNFINKSVNFSSRDKALCLLGILKIGKDDRNNSREMEFDYRRLSELLGLYTHVTPGCPQKLVHELMTDQHVIPIANGYKRHFSFINSIGVYKKDTNRIRVTIDSFTFEKYHA